MKMYEKRLFALKHSSIMQFDNVKLSPKNLYLIGKNELYKVYENYPFTYLYNYLFTYLYNCIKVKKNRYLESITKKHY